MRKRMAWLLALTLLLTGCAVETGVVGPGRPVAAYIEPDVAAADVTHTVAGQTSRWTATGDALEALRAWVNGLQYELVTFDEGQPPGDGGEVYEVIPQGSAYPGFSYVIVGAETCYLRIEGHWYTVTNPSRPPAKDA